MPNREFPCCMCPAIYADFQNEKEICAECDFLKTFTDERGWKYFVRGGLGESNYKTFYQKPNSNSQKGCRMTEWRKLFREAQEDLNGLGKEKGWTEGRVQKR